MEFSCVTELCRVAEQAVNNAASIQTTLQSITNFRLTLLMNLIRITKRQGEPKMGAYRDSRHKFYITPMRERIVARELRDHRHAEPAAQLLRQVALPRRLGTGQADARERRHS